MKTIIFVGHLSRFGIAFYEAMLEQSLFDVKEVVIADAWRWQKFRCRLNGRNFKDPGKKERRQHNKATNQIKRQSASIPVRVINDANQESLYSLLSSYDIMLTAAFPQLFSEPIANAPRLGSVNFHPSYLPRCRGAHPIYWAIASQEPYSGVSSHIITRKIDAGPLLARVKIEYDPDTITYSELYRLSIRKLPTVIEQTYAVITGAREKPQITERHSYFRNDRTSDHRIRWQEDTKKQISAKVRAGQAFVMKGIYEIMLNPPLTMRENIENISSCFLEHLPYGTIISIDGQRLCVKCKSGYLIAEYEVRSPYRIIRKIYRIFKRFGVSVFYLQKITGAFLKEGDILS